MNNRNPTMQDVAHEAGVSRALVSLVMRGQPNVSEERRLRVLQAARHLGYRPNAMARSLASQRTRTVGVVLDDLANPFFAEIVRGIDDFATEVGYQLLLGTGSLRPERERQALEMLLEYRADGIILISPRMAAADIVKASHDVPVVVVARDVRDANADLVMTDDRRGIELVLDHLVGLGHKRISHVDGGSGAGARLRRSSYLRGMRARGLEKYANAIHGDYTEQAGVRAAKAMIETGELPTAVFGANDMIAAGLLGAFDQAGVQVPSEISIVGYDNVYIAHLAHVSLTTIDQPRLQMGRLALELLLDRIETPRGPVVRRLEPTLVVRSTSARPRRR